MTDNLDADQITVSPIVGALDLDVPLPGSKSLTNRALIVAALAKGRSTLAGVGLSDDTLSLIHISEPTRPY